MYKRMVIPLDGSEVAESVLPYVKELAVRFGIYPIFLYVCDSHETSSLAVYQGYIEHMAENISNYIQENTGTPTRDKVLKAEGKAVVGHPAEEILRCADEKEADLILMATHGRSGIKRWALGSIADKVLRSSTIPVWLIRATAPAGKTVDKESLKTILVPLDGSELAESVLPHVEMLAKQGDAEAVNVVLIQVCEPLTILPVSTLEVPVNWGSVMEEHMGYARKAAGQYLAGVTARLTAAGLKVSSEVIEGHPASEIINYANKTPSSIIAMATHGRSGIGRWTYGSVAEKILSGASHPIFLVRPPTADGLSLVRTFIGTVKTLPPI